MSRASDPEPLELSLRTGVLRAHRFGDERDALVLAIPGVDGNSRCFDYLGERLARRGRQVVALDLGGRGHSSVSGPGTYGWRRHAIDVLEAAALLGQRPAALVGYSMGAYVAMQAAALSSAPPARLALIDALSAPDMLAAAVILRVAQRLAWPSSSVAEYLERVRQLGVIEPWSDYWERCFAYELEETHGGVRPRTSLSAVLEDSAYALWRNPRGLWTSLSMPVLLVRATQPLLAGAGLVVSAADRDRFLREVPHAQAVDVDANHYGVIVDPDTVAALDHFLSTLSGTKNPVLHLDRLRPDA